MKKFLMFPYFGCHLTCVLKDSCAHINRKPGQQDKVDQQWKFILMESQRLYFDIIEQNSEEKFQVGH